MLAALLVAVCALALPVSSAFGEGSVDTNTGPGTAYRNNLAGLTAAHVVLSVYARAGETIQMASSAQNIGGGTILLYPPGSNVPSNSLPGGSIENCAGQGGAGYMGTSRAAELAGPEPPSGDLDPNTYNPCEFTATVDGIYEVVMLGPDPTSSGGGGGTVNSPIFLNDPPRQEGYVAMWDVTVRDAAEAKQPGRVFTNAFNLKSVFSPNVASNWESYVYTSTGYEYRTALTNPAGLNWVLQSTNTGLRDAATLEPLRASTYNDDPVDRTGVGVVTHSLFVSSVDPIVISGPGGLGATKGYEAAPITPAMDPLKNLAFTGAGGASGVTPRGSGGTISFDSPAAMNDLVYDVAIDFNRDGVYGNNGDVTDTSTLSSAGNSFAWDGKESTGATPGCGTYSYQISTSLSEVHFTLADMEGFDGMTIERLTLPADPSLPGPFAASYNDITPYVNRQPPPVPGAGDNVSGASPATVTNGDSSVAGFHAWAYPNGDNRYIDTWSSLPEIIKSGTLQLLCADVQVVKSAASSPAVPGEDVTFRLAVTNNGPNTATSVVVTDDLPDTVTFKSASQGCAEAASVVTCSLASLPAGATHTFEIVAAVPSSATQCIQNTATVTNTTPDPNTANNSSTICVPVVGKTGVSMTKTASTTTVAPGGGQVMYTLVVRNAGPSDDPDVKVTDPLPAGLTLVAAQASQGSCTTASNTVSCSLGALKDGGSAQVLVTVNTMGTAGCITNTARAQGSRPDPNPGDNEASARVCVEPPPVLPTTFDLAVDKRASVSRPVIGQSVTYRIVVRNNGPGAAPAAKLTDTYNNRATVVSVRTTQGTCTRQLPITCDLGRIESGRSVTITMVIKPLETGRQRNAASATSCCGTDRDPKNNMDTADINVQKIALKLTKVASREVVRGGETFSYRIRASNPTKGEARDVKVCDRLPSGLRYVSSQPRARVSGRQQCWTIKSLAAGKSRTFRVTVRAANGASGRKTNTATLTSPDSPTLRSRDTVRLIPLPDRPTG